MLKKYEETQEAIKTQEAQVEEESASISNLLTEKKLQTAGSSESGIHYQRQYQFLCKPDQCKSG